MFSCLILLNIIGKAFNSGKPRQNAEKSVDKIELNVGNFWCKDKSDMAVSNKYCVPLTVTVDIERNPLDDDSSDNNKSSLGIINSVRCSKISTIDEIDSSSTVFSSDSSIIDDICSNAFELNNSGVIPFNKSGQSSGFCAPNLLNVGSMHNCTEIEVGGQKIYNGPVTINHIVASKT